jgi:hypothetical protein
VSVYFITAREVDRVKIGYAHNPVARYRHLQVSSPVKLALEGAIPGGFEKERELHRRYARVRVCSARVSRPHIICPVVLARGKGVRRSPRDFVLFAGGGIYVAVLIQSPKLLGLVERMM